jgi:hypothetical protein
MLTEAAIRNAKPREKPYKLFDERGLFMLVVPTCRSNTERDSLLDDATL